MPWSVAAAAVAAAAAAAAVAYVAMRPAPVAGGSPFSAAPQRPRGAVDHNKQRRDAVLKCRLQQPLQGQHYDAVVIGSGMGGLTTAVLLAKTGKKVLVLEQHGKAGGCMHTFGERGYVFDTGIHYIGKMMADGINRFLFDQLSDGQVEWQALDSPFDEVLVGNRRVPIYAGPEAFANGLKTAFPNEHKAIDKYMLLLKQSRKYFVGLITLKFLPLWLVKFLVFTGLINWVTDAFKMASKSVKQVLEELTSDKDLRAVLAYNFGDYGTLPSDTPFPMHATLVNHFLDGGAYPVGGTSELPVQMIPLITRAGGQVVTGAPVVEIVLDATKTKAVGVKVQNRGKIELVTAPIIVSGAGLFNTIDLLKSPERHSLASWGFQSLQSGWGGVTVFVGLRGSNAENKLARRNYWIFRGADLEGEYRKYVALPREEALCDAKVQVPLLFVSFPSAKDPEWDKTRPDKSTAEIVTLLPYSWFEEWKDLPVTKRGEDYGAYKEALGAKMWQVVAELFPHLADKVEFIEVGTPLSHKHYLNAQHGEIYGLDHNFARFSPLNTALLRPQTAVANLYLTGQDILSCGWSGAMFSGLLTASAILKRNLLHELVEAMKGFYANRAKAQQNGHANGTGTH